MNFIDINGVKINTDLITNVKTKTESTDRVRLTIEFDNGNEEVFYPMTQNEVNTVLTALTTFNGNLAVGQYSNIGISLSSGTLKITQANGGDLATYTPGYIAFPKASDKSKAITLAITSALHKINDATAAGGSQITERFSTTNLVAWPESRPLFIYAVNTDDTSAGVYFALSFAPNLSESPYDTGAPGDFIGYAGQAMLDHNDKGMIFMTTTNTTAFTELPCVRIGYVLATKDATNAWTFSAPALGFPNDEKPFKFPTGQFGAASGNHLKANGGTAPTWNDKFYHYQVHDDGLVTVGINLNGDGGVDGAGAVNVICTLPYATSEGDGESIMGFGVVQMQRPGVALGHGFINVARAQPYFEINTNNTGTFLQNADFSNGARYIAASFTYQAFQREYYR